MPRFCKPALLRGIRLQSPDSTGSPVVRGAESRKEDTGSCLSGLKCQRRKSLFCPAAGRYCKRRDVTVVC